MRRRNTRLVISGAVLAALSVAFFFVMTSFAPQSNNPKALLQIVGQVSGAVAGVGIVLAIIGLVGKKR